MNQNLRAAILTRVSTREQAESGTSLQTQEQHAREYIEGCGYTLIESYVIREDHTGTDLERPGIKRLLHGASIGMLDVVVSLTQDRVYRPAEAGDEWCLLELLDRFKKVGVSFEFSTGSVPSDGPFAGMFSILDSWRAGEERRKIVERTQRGRRARLAEGKYLYVPPFGYETDEDGRLQVNTEQAEVVRRIFDLYLTERLGVRKIQSRLTGTVPSPSGRHVWSQNTVLRILKSECYWSGRHSSGVPCPPIIEEQQAVQAHKRLESNRRFKPAKGKPWALQGRIRCACGGAWRTEKASPRKGKDTYYCRNRLSASYYAMSRGQKCTMPRIRRDELDYSVAEAVFSAIQSPEALARSTEASIAHLRASTESIDGEVSEIESAPTEVDRELIEIDRARIRGRVPVAELNREEKEALDLQSVLQNRLDTYDAETLDELERARQVLGAVEDLGAWAGTYDRYQAVNRNGIKGYINTDAPPVDEAVARYVAVARPEWLASEPPASFDEEESNEAFSELLDRLQAEVLIHFDRVEITGLVPVVVPPGAPDPLHANTVPRELEGGLLCLDRPVATPG